MCEKRLIDRVIFIYIYKYKILLYLFYTIGNKRKIKL